MTDRGPGELAGPLLELVDVNKYYGRVQALADISFRAEAGEIVAIVGDNGAGKSTLVKTIAGVHQPDAGCIRVHGREVSFVDPHDAQSHGVSTVFQDLALVEALEIARNMFLGREPTRWGLVDHRRMIRDSQATFESLGIKVPSMRSNVGSLSGGQRQGVAIARAVIQGGELIVMDEPTAALGVRETLQIMDIVRNLREKGKGIVIVSHNLEQVLDLADRIVVIRLGRVAGERLVKDTDHREIVGLITGALTPLQPAGVRYTEGQSV